MLAPWIQLTGDIDGYSGTIPTKLKGTPMPLTDYSSEARFNERVATAALKHYQMNGYELECEHCGKPFTSSRRDKLTCSGKCQKALQRSGKRPKGVTGIGRAANRATPLPDELMNVHFRPIVKKEIIPDRDIPPSPVTVTKRTNWIVFYETVWSPITGTRFKHELRLG